MLIPHGRRLGLRFVEKKENSLIIEMSFNPELEIIPGSGIMANGALTAFMDTALGAAVYDQFDLYRKIVTLDLRMDYFEKPQPFSSVIVKTRCLKITNQVAFVQGDIYDSEDASPIAHGVGVFSHSGVEKTS
ncbi:MAG: hypothetical protein COB54_04325 [Alphaproteobacteria bacterium]|nr:MAG: hypothetical protein COB54_04325 [Alphaproteobacteria bacterium]